MGNPLSVQSAVERIKVSTTEHPFQCHKFSKKIGKMEATSLDIVRDNMPSSETDVFIKAFIAGDPAGALARLGELQRAGTIDLEDQSEHSPGVAYLRFLIIYTRAMNGPCGRGRCDVMEQFLCGSVGVRATIDELGSQMFRAKRDCNPSESGTARAISKYFTLIFTVSCADEFLMDLGIELRELNYFDTLRDYALSKYASSFMSIFSLTSLTAAPILKLTD